MKKVLFLLVLFIVFFSLAGNIFADTDTSSDDVSFTLCPPQSPPDDTGPSNCETGPTGNYITDFTRKVTVSFSGLTGDPSSYKICYRTDYCLSDIVLGSMEPAKLQSLLSTAGVKGDKLSTTRLNTPGTDLDFTNYNMTVCGHGNGDLYANGDKGVNHCDSEDHWFHAGHSYHITVYAKGNDDQYLAVAFAGFYVNHGIPTITLTPSDKNFSTKGTQFELSIKEAALRGGGKNNNDYQVVMEGPGYKKEECDWIDESTNPRVFNFPLQQGPVMHYADADKDPDLLAKGFTLPGQYIFKINEQINESSAHSDDCQGGHTYMQITCKMSSDPAKSTCTKKEDPNGDDASDLLALLAKLNGVSEGSQLPCSNPKGPISDPTKCNVLDTSIGPIEVDVVGFTTRLFSIVLTVAGLGAMILIIFSGYRLLLSRGNKEVIQGARQTLTSAIIGLFFIIFSLVLLSVIAGDILRIPGFK